MSPREKFMALLANDRLQKADAIVVLEGDLFERNTEAARLYGELKIAPLVVFSGGDTSKLAYARPASEMQREFLKRVPNARTDLEVRSQHTGDQATEIMKMAKERGWKSIIIVASHYHQYRAFLTFLKAMRESGLSLVLSSSPAKPKWFEILQNNRHERRIDALEDEFKKIDAYRNEFGNVATYDEGIEYLQWKESQQ